MKKHLTFILVACLAFNLSGQTQKGLKWVQIDNTRDDYLFRYFYKYSDDVYKAIFTIPEIKPFQPMKNQIFVRTYKGDLSKYDEVGIPSESPYELSVTGFKDYTVIFGSTDENKNPFLKYHKDNKLLITDAQMNPLLTVSYPVHGKKNRFEGIPSAYKSHDSSNLIILNNELLESESKPFHETPVVHYINIYDKNLGHVWCDSVKFMDIFENNVVINHYSFDFINDKLYLIATTGGNGMKKIKPEIFVVRFDKPGSHNIIARRTFINQQFGWEHIVRKNGELVISGLNFTENSASKKALFFIRIDLNTPNAEALIKSIPIDKVLLSKYPSYKSLLPNNLASPGDLLQLKDGLLYCSEYHMIYTRSSSTSSSTTYYVKGISFIKFDFEGNIEWIKMIDKSTASGSAFYPYFCRAFVSNGDVVVFYYDYMENIFREKPSGKLRFVNDYSLCLAKAIVDGEGNFKKSFIYKIGEDGTRADLTTMRQISPTVYFVTGSGVKIKTRGDFAAFYDLKGD
jgi:hypothetical protein